MYKATGGSEGRYYIQEAEYYYYARSAHGIASTTLAARLRWKAARAPCWIACTGDAHYLAAVPPPGWVQQILRMASGTLVPVVRHGANRAEVVNWAWRPRPSP